MLTIENYNKIVNKPLGKRNFYVERIEERLLYNPITFGAEGEYIIHITNRKYSVTITLDRLPLVNEQNYYKMYAIGKVRYLTLYEIRDIDKFLDRIRLVGID
jgi:hypothetical protein